MKEYIKPIIEVVEFRIEERLAFCNNGTQSENASDKNQCKLQISSNS